MRIVYAARVTVKNGEIKKGESFRMKTKRFIALLFALLLALGAVMPVFAEGEASQIDGYSITSSNGKIVKGSIVTIAVKLRAPHVKTADGKSIEAILSCDAFQDGSIRVEVNSEDNEFLRYTVIFSDVKYTGQGNLLKFVVHYNGTGLPTEWMAVPIVECTSGEITTAAPKTEPSSSRAASTPAIPYIQINREERKTPVTAGESFTVNVVFLNPAPAAASNAVASFTPGEGLVLEESTASKSVGTIPANGVVPVPVKLKASNPIQTASLMLSVTLKYTYAAADGKIVEGSAQERILIPATVTKTPVTKSDSVAPTVIISQYDYGGSSVAAGEPFQLALSFRNTSKNTSAENVTMVVSTSENLAITSSSNTFHIASLKPSEIQKQTVEMMVPANTALTSAKVTVSFRYEYVIDGARTASTSSESISLPVYQPNSFSLTEPDPVFATRATEVALSIPYINQGKGEVKNVEAKIEFGGLGDATCEEQVKLVGNVAAGRSGSIDFFFTPNVAGELKLSVTVTYEDEMEEPRIVTMPLVMTVEEPDANNGEVNNNPYNIGGRRLPKAVIVAIAIGGVSLLVIIVSVIITIRKRRAFYAWQAGFGWGNEDPRNRG